MLTALLVALTKSIPLYSWLVESLKTINKPFHCWNKGPSTLSHKSSDCVCHTLPGM